MAVYEEDLDEAIETVRAWIAEAKSILVLTGAGISTDSGIPDFRGPKGLWTKNPKAERMATLDHYMSSREVRERSWKNRADAGYAEREPNAGHHALADLEKTGRLHTLITQNVDGLHLRGGTSAEKLVEIHGNVREVVCMDCGERAAMERALARVRAGEADPPCRSCGGILKSATISFGQGLVRDDLQRSEEAAQGCDLLLAIGSTLGVFPIANVVPIAKSQGSRIVILNAEATEMDALGDVVIRGSISDVLPRLTSGTA
ncbi:MAG: NAD-dependent deacetylase [Deltaproteobacteria bacterium]|nr:NAD-dependent deacetylase [Deltaproteobacteria bacterium]